jgi:uncharacterized membrane protein YphA (DoxX/SURF4 family)
MSLQTGLKTRAASMHRLIGQLGYRKGLFVWSDWTAAVIPGPQQGPIPYAILLIGGLLLLLLHNLVFCWLDIAKKKYFKLLKSCNQVLFSDFQ